MSPTRSLALAAALALTALGAPATTTVSIVGSAGPGAFNPNPVTIASGDSVAWTNNDATVHHIVLDDGTYDSGTIFPGASSPATTAVTATGTYHCTIHPSMTGTITVSGACSFTIAPTSASIAAAGAAGTVNVTAGAGCAWTATSNSSFITIVAGAAGSGNGTVSYSVAANPSTTPRTGTVTIAGQTLTITQAGASCAPIVIAPATLGAMTQGVAFSAPLSASGGTAPYSFTVSSGSLPAGLTLSAAGLLSGTPTTPGTVTFSARATDAGGCAADMAYTVTVLPSVPSMPQTLLILFAIAMVASGWWFLGRRRGASPS